MLKMIIAAASVVVLSGCATASGTAIMVAGDVSRVKASTAIAPTGDTIVKVSKYQFFPDASAMTVLCKAALEEKIARPLADGQMRIKHGRNILTGISNCESSI